MATRRELRRAAHVLISGAAAPVRGVDQDGADRACRRARRWLEQPGVQGIGIARKRTDGELRNTLSLRVYVEKKLPRLRCTELVPATLKVSGQGRRVVTDVVEIGRIRPQKNNHRIRPVPGGFSVGHSAVSFGTLGGLVREPGRPAVFLLSCSHVLADSGFGNPGDPIEQPGRADQDGPGDYQIASLVRAVPLTFSQEGFPNRVDAAIAEAIDPTSVQPGIFQIGTPSGTSGYLREGMVVRKSGRTSGLTEARIEDIDAQVQLDYKRPSGHLGRVGFGNQVLCTGFTEDGDSGALVFNHERAVVGLHFAGSDKASIFNRISFVLDELGVVLAVG